MLKYTVIQLVIYPENVLKQPFQATKDYKSYCCHKIVPLALQPVSLEVRVDWIRYLD